MADQFIGEIRLFAGNFAPTGWAFCNGQLLPLSQNTALFSLLLTAYGGDGLSTFALPDLRDRVPIHSGQGPGLSDRLLGSTGGNATISLKGKHVPTHTHPAASTPGTTDDPTGAVPARGGNYAAVGPTFTDGEPHNNLPPYLGLTFIIALQGIYPARS
jgi:microcystin-dependent protein